MIRVLQPPSPGTHPGSIGVTIRGATGRARPAHDGSSGPPARGSRRPARARRPAGLAAVVLALALPALLTLAEPTGLEAQYMDAPPPAAYALAGVTVVEPDGRRTVDVTVVVRGGFVEAVGTDVAVPADARLLEGDSLRVYPGFVDADGELPGEFPEPEVEREEVESWDPPREVQGFQPERRLVDVLEATGEDVEEPREGGAVAMALLPEGPTMPGRGTVVILRPDAETPRELVVHPALGPVLTFDDPRGAYPGTLFGLMAFYRQTFEDARRHERVAQARSRDPRGLLSVWDPSLEVLRQTLEGDLPVYFRADGAGDIRRVLGLADEYGFRPVIVGGEEAWKLADELRRRDVPVLVSLDFPEPERWEPDEEDPDSATAEPDTAEAPPGEEPDTAEAPPGEEPDTAEAPLQEEPDPAAVRERRRIEAAYANAGRLEGAGVRFALTSGRGEAELLEGARKAIEYGLSEEAALRALTATPAELFSIPEVTTLRVGYPATFIVTDGPLFDEDTELRWSLVEGHLQTLEAEAGTEEDAGDEAPAADLSGAWDIRVVTELGERYSGTMELEQEEDGTLSGTFDLGVVTGRIREGSISGDRVRMTGRFTMGEETLTARFRGTIEGDEISGSGTVPDGRFEWTAERSGPGGRP